MTVREAVELIDSSKISTDRIQRWADLGCGAGIFSQALATLLPQGSNILCIDRDEHLFREPIVKGVSLEFLQTDFIQFDFEGENFDGFILANSLHYVKEKHSFVQRLTKSLKKPGSIIIVEYDTEKSNPWVPYPISFAQLPSLFDSDGINGFHLRKIGERPSIYGSDKMYACEVILS
jgi:trans-aconitate methyltransferase